MDVPDATKTVLQSFKASYAVQMKTLSDMQLICSGQQTLDPKIDHCATSTPPSS